jgi:hypothetical protein
MPRHSGLAAIKNAGIIAKPGEKPPKEDLEDNILDECCSAI